MKQVLFFISLWLPLKLEAQTIKAFYIGHSLSDGVIDMVNSLSAHHEGVSMEFRYQTIPGSPLRWNWQAKDRNDYLVNDPFYCGFYHPVKGLPSGQFDVLVLTESVPRFPAVIEETYAYADSFYQYANRFNANTRVFVYEVWHCIHSNAPNPCAWDVPAPSWRKRLETDLPMWEGVVGYLNEKYQPKNPVCLIPAGQALAILYDAIEKGEVPGINQIADLFSDDIHLNDKGKYFVACVHFSMLHRISPVGLPAQLYNMWGTPYEPPSALQAVKFQQLAWEAVLSYPGSCVESIASVDDEPARGLKLYPNPVVGRLTIQGQIEPVHWELYNMFGIKVLDGIGAEVELSHMPPGMYLFKSGEVVEKVLIR